MKESRRVDQGIRRRAMIKSKISCLSNVYVGSFAVIDRPYRKRKSSRIWPEIFRDAKPVPADESSQIPMAQQDVYEADSDS
ncbi:hypothetical protein YC2023_049800 [Brassica napus]